MVKRVGRHFLKVEMQLELYRIEMSDAFELALYSQWKAILSNQSRQTLGPHDLQYITPEKRSNAVVILSLLIQAWERRKFWFVLYV